MPNSKQDFLSRGGNKTAPTIGKSREDSEYNKKYREINREQIKKQRREYYLAHREKICARVKKAYQELDPAVRKLRARETYYRNIQTRQDYRKNNHDRLLRESREYYSNNKAYFATYRLEKAEHYKEWRKENAEYLKEQKRLYHKANRDRHLEYNKKMKGHYQLWAKEYRRRNSTKILAYNASKRAHRHKATPLWADKGKIRMFYETAKLYNELYPEQAPWHVDHIVPLKGQNICGFHVEYNLQLLPRTVNCSKGNRTI